MAGIPSPTDNPIVEAVRSASKRILDTAIVNRKDWGAHSCKLIAGTVDYGTVREAFLRSGGATMAANNGVSDRVFQRHDRWKSVHAKDTYVDDDLSPNSLGSKPCEPLVLIYHAFAQFFVTLNGWFLSGPPKINLFVSAMLCG